MADKLPGHVPQVLKHYRIRRRIGAGGMGAVFEADDRRDRSRVALKLLHSHLADDEAFRERFEREAHVAALLRSPYTVHLLDFGEADGYLFLVMEYIAGASLADMIQAGPIPPMKALRVASEVARALEEAEARGVIHRDIKPENILIIDEDSVKVADFGIARRVGGGGVTEIGGFVGSVLYASPEQARGEADRRSDIYALGGVLYAMLAGHPPFEGAMLDVLRQHAEESLPVGPLAGLPDAVVNIVRRCLEKDPQDRYQSASELAGALERAQRYVKSWQDRRPGSTAGAPYIGGTMPPAVTGDLLPAGSDSNPPAVPPATEEAAPEEAATSVALTPGSTGPGNVVLPAATVVATGETPAASEAAAAAQTLVYTPPADPAPDVTLLGPSALAPGPLEAPETTARGPEPAGQRRPDEALKGAVAGRDRARLSSPPATGAESPRERHGIRMLVGMLSGLGALALVGFAAFNGWLPWPGPEEVGDVAGNELASALDDGAAGAFAVYGEANARRVNQSAGAHDADAVDSVRVTIFPAAASRFVDFVVFPSAAAARRYANDITQEAGLAGGTRCATGNDLPDAPRPGDTSTCYERSEDVVIIASAPASAPAGEAEALLGRAVEVVEALRKRETPPRATAATVRTPTAAATPTQPPTPPPVPTATTVPSPTPIPVPIAAGTWQYNFQANRNDCPFGPLVGDRFPQAFRLEETTPGDSLISPGELVDVTQDETDFFIGRFTFTFPNFAWDYPVVAAGETGLARVSNTFFDANNGTATLLEVYALKSGGTCTLGASE